MKISALLPPGKNNAAFSISYNTLIFNELRRDHQIAFAVPQVLRNFPFTAEPF
jgi:hypothetical protein